MHGSGHSLSPHPVVVSAPATQEPTPHLLQPEYGLLPMPIAATRWPCPLLLPPGHDSLLQRLQPCIIPPQLHLKHSSSTCCRRYGLPGSSWTSPQLPCTCRSRLWLPWLTVQPTSCPKKWQQTWPAHLHSSQHHQVQWSMSHRNAAVKAQNASLYVRGTSPQSSPAYPMCPLDFVPSAIYTISPLHGR